MLGQTGQLISVLKALYFKDVCLIWQLLVLRMQL
uniref:Uncharacterized protein n=1 Tax=Anguilla anguilla TaxID=7936 RepID=A0A0E9XGU4_ANGAN